MAKNKAQLWRRLIQAGVALIVLGLAAAHAWLDKAIFPPVDAYCPYGALETLWRLIASGLYIEKTYLLNLVLGGALIILALVFGGVFCGWICPFGGIQDWLQKLSRKLHLPRLTIPPKVSRWLGLLRYVVFALIILKTVQLTTLWFSGYDPFRTLFGLHWLTEPESLNVLAWAILGLVLVGSLFISRPWCRFFCPLGGVVDLVSRLSPFRLRRNQQTCTNCKACDKTCPLALVPSQDKTGGCNLCGECVARCPVAGTLATGYKPAAKPSRIIVTPLVSAAALAIIVAFSFIFGWTNLLAGDSPQNIKGWMTLGQVAEAYGLSLEELKAGIGLENTAAASGDQLKRFENDPLAPGYSVETVREFLADKAGGESLPAEPKAATDESAQAIPAETVAPTTPENSAPTPREQPKVQSTPAAPTASVAEEAAQAAAGLPDVSGIKGSMTLKEVIDIWHLDARILYEKLGLPDSVPAGSIIRDLEPEYGIGGQDVRDAVQAIIGS